MSKADINKYLKKFWFIYIFSLVFISIIFLLISLGWLGFMPSFEELENPKSNQASEIYASDGVLLGKYFIENRSNISYEDLSPDLIKALIATEDVRFEQHSGVDLKAIPRVIFGILTFNNKGGGSTITQQLAKNLFPRGESPSFIEVFFVKLKEWVTAVKLEKNYTKDEIMAMYFNTVPFGSNTYGIKTASKTYFSKEPYQLKIEEAALLVGMLKAPSYYNPVRNTERAKNRRNVVLNQMRKYDFITKEQYDSLKMIAIDMKNYQSQDHVSGKATYFREYLRGYLNDWAKEHNKPDGTKYDIYKDGLKIYTTINSKMQQYAEEAVKEHLGGEMQPLFFSHWKGVRNAPFDRNLKQDEIDKLMNQAIKRSDRYRNMKKGGSSEKDISQAFNTKIKMRVFTYKGDRDTIMSPFDSLKYYKYFLLCGLMSVEPQTGYVRAYVGGIDYRYFKFDHVMLSKRQVGSTFKPILYTLAMQEGEFSPCTSVPNVPVSFNLADGTIWTPVNSDNDREGEMVTLKWALANSVNYVSAYLMKRYSPEAVIQVARKMGITSEIPAVPSICLGTPDISVYEMTGAMSCFSNKGVHIEPTFITKIEDKNGNIIESFFPKKNEAFNEATAYLMINLMKGVVEGGTGSRIRYKYKIEPEVAGKTGTTQNNSDGWFMGLTPTLVTGVWVGCEDRSVHFRSITYGQGATLALPIWALYMRKIYSDKSLKFPTSDFENPDNELPVEIDCSKYKQPENWNNKVNEDKY